MKKLVLLILIFLSLGCKKNNENKTSTPVIIETISEIEDEPKTDKRIPKTIFDYISFGEKKYAISVNENIEGIIAIDDVSLFKEEESKKVFLAMRLSESLPEGVYGKYRVMAIMFPYNLEEITVKYSLENNLDHEIWYYDLKTHPDEVNNEYLWGQVANDIEEFKKVILRIINLETGEVFKKEIVIDDLITE